jgi:hypothetical protein
MYLFPRAAYERAMQIASARRRDREHALAKPMKAAVFVLLLGAIGLQVGPAGAATTWTRHTTPNPAGSTQIYLNAVSCTAATECTAVGDWYNVATAATSPLAERWNGTAWKIQTTHQPTGSTYAILQGVSCKSATECIAVGFSSTAAGGFPLAEMWNGISWKIQTTPHAKNVTNSQLTSVSCTSTTACTAVGYSAGLVLAETWNGTAWSLQTIPTPTTGTLAGVSCVSNVCAAVGYSSSLDESFSEVRVGGVWKIKPIPIPAIGASDLFGVSCTSSTSCTAVGSFLNIGFVTTTLVEVWNGTVWSVQPSANDAAQLVNKLTGVSCRSANACTAVGYTQTGYTTLAEAWNGTTWKLQTTAALPAGSRYPSLSGVSCTTASTCTAVGSFLGTTGYTSLAEAK